ncbi:MAG: FtsX-like permease family protein [bacterium]|nr:FtsX-like permease family protein [bacterium]
MTTALRALIRVELRQLRRHPGRSWLVILLVAVPVAAIVGGTTLLSITRATVEEQKTRAMGRADLRVIAEDADGVRAARALLPSDARVAELRGGRAHVSVPGRRLAARVQVVRPGALEAGGLAEGLLVVESGRAPVAARELALAPVLLAGLERAVGETVMLGENEYEISGVVVDPEKLDLPLVLCGDAPDDVPLRTHLLVGALSDAAAIAGRLRTDDRRVVERAAVGGQDGFEELVIFVIGGLGLLEAAFVIAAAFAVGLRRRQREIGLLQSTGASGGGIRVAMVTSAGALALVGGALGTAVGTAVAAALHPFLDGWNGRRNGVFETSAIHVASAVALGVVVALAAALWPARTATRLPVRVALSGRRPVTAGSGRWLMTGLVAIGAGIVSVLIGARGGNTTAGTLLLAGSVLGVIGFGLSSPWILDQLARRATGLPLAWRLAVRDAGRFRARNGPVVTAVLAGMSVSVTVAALLASIRTLPEFERSMMRDDWLIVEGAGAGEVSRALAEELEALARAPLAATHARGAPIVARYSSPDSDSDATQQSWVASASEGLLAALDAEDGAGVLAAGGALALSVDGAAEVVELVTGTGRVLETLALERFEANLTHRGPRMVVAPRDGLEAGPPPGSELVPWVVRLEAPVTPAVLERARVLAAGVPGTTVDADLLHRSPTRGFYRVVLLVCFATGLVVLVVATALSSVESASEARILATVGATPALLRGHLAARTGYLALLGCVLAIPAGMIPAAGLILMAPVPLALTVPWTEVLITVVGLPATAYGGAWLLAALRCPAPAGLRD